MPYSHINQITASMQDRVETWWQREHHGQFNPFRPCVHCNGHCVFSSFLCFLALKTDWDLLSIVIDMYQPDKQQLNPTDCIGLNGLKLVWHFFGEEAFFSFPKKRGVSVWTDNLWLSRLFVCKRIRSLDHYVFAPLWYESILCIFKKYIIIIFISNRQTTVFCR